MVALVVSTVAGGVAQAPRHMHRNKLIGLMEPILCMRGAERRQLEQAGSVKRKVVVSSGTLSTSIVPPCASTSALLMYKPSPTPVTRPREAPAREKRLKRSRNSSPVIP